MNLKEVQRVVSEIKASLFKNSNSYAIGMLKSHFKGSGLQFKEHRVYTHGDDIRFIDWKMLAKTRTPFVKTFEEERNVEICVVIDASSSMFMGIEGTTKFQAALEICCLLYLLSKETGDVIHALVVGDEIVNVEKATGEKGIAAIIGRLERAGYLNNNGEVIIPDRASQVDEDRKLKSIMKHLGRKREIVILSDFNEFLGGEQLRRLVVRKNVHSFRLLSPIDIHEKTPFSVWGGGGDGKGGLFQVNSVGEEFKKLLAGKVKDIKIEDRYLDRFVREMM